MKHLLVVVDMQNDFIDMALGTPEAEMIIEDVVKAIKDPQYDAVIATMDTHEWDYMQSLEGKYLPVEHCIRGTQGWRLNDRIEIALRSRDAAVFEKPTFACTDLAQYLAGERPESVTFCGLCTDICVVSNVLLAKACLYDHDIYVIEQACAGTTPAKHKAAIETMESCQIQIL